MKKKKGIGNEGFTLTEVIVSMVILGLLFIPLMKYFTNSLKYAAITAQKQNATLTAQEIVEYFKGRDLLITRQEVKESDGSAEMVKIYDISNELKTFFFGAPIPTQTKDKLLNDQPLYEPDTGVGEMNFQYATEAPDGNKYDVKVKFKTDISANEIARPIIYGIDETRTVVAAESTEFEDAVVYFLGAHMAALTRQGDDIADVPVVSPSPSASPEPSDSAEAFDLFDEGDESEDADGDEDGDGAGDASDPSEPLVELTEEEIRDNIERTINVTVENASSDADLLLGTKYLRVRVEYVYSCLGITSMTDKEEYPITIVDQTIEDLESLYLMFNLVDEQKDEIIIDWQADTPASKAASPEFVLICQNLQKEDDGYGGGESYYNYDLNLRLRGNFDSWPWNNDSNSCEVRTNICDTADLDNNHGSISLLEYGVVAAPGTLICKPLTTSGTSVRLVEITVEVYRKGDIDAGGDPLATVITTKGE